MVEISRLKFGPDFELKLVKILSSVCRLVDVLVRWSVGRIVGWLMVYLFVVLLVSSTSLLRSFAVHTIRKTYLKFHVGASLPSSPQNQEKPDGHPEVEFVQAVTAGGSVNFLPAV